MAKVKITAKTFSVLGKDGERRILRRGDVVDMPDDIAKRCAAFMEAVPGTTNQKK